MEHTHIIYIKVILPIKLEWEPWYSVGTTSPTDDTYIKIGERVRVPFAGKEYIGIVSQIAAAPEIDSAKVKKIISIERKMEVVSEKEICFWRQVATYYMCTVGEVFKAASPAFRTNFQKVKAAQTERMEKKLEKSISVIDKKITTYSERIIKRKESLLSARKESVISRLSEEIERLENEIAKLRTEKDSLKSTLDRSRICIQTENNITNESAYTESSQPRPSQKIVTGISLSQAQNEAYDSILRTFRDRKTAFLNGVTGSGKTEIYICLAAQTMNSGRNALYLVPEIALSKQLEDRLYTVFGKRMFVFHSGETAAERNAVSQMMEEAEKKGESYTVIGTRSALFLPHKNLGLIIVDEEHDSSYKQDSPAPRYNGRDTAAMLASIHSSSLLLGSATPSLESLYNCKTGKYSLTTLSEKFHGSSESDTMIIDTTQERKKRGMRGSLSLKLIFEIKKTIERGEQVIILRSRRSYSPAMQCTECGNIPKCPQCNLPLSYHKASGKDTCHYCGYSSTHTGKCKSCGCELSGLGAGTQKIEEEISEQFPMARIARLDSDSAQNRSYESKVIKEFSEGKTDILIGTQMVTKGFDFKGLTLVAVIGTDSLLAVQDFRADEKAMQILEQFRGRCGRREKKGLFIIQTSQPHHPVYLKLAGTDCTISEETLLSERKEFGYPPFCRLIDINIKDNNTRRLEKMSGLLAGTLAKLNFQTTGPYISKNRIFHENSGDTTPDTGSNLPDTGMQIRTIRLSIPKNKDLAPNKELISETILSFEKKMNYRGHITTDVDPL